VPRLLTALAVLLLLLVGLGVLTWYLAFGVSPRTADDAAVPGLGAEVSITYDADGLPTIAASSEADLVTGLGYVHAFHGAWPMALWRQAAAGRLSGWLADSTALALDRHALALGFEALARETYRRLSEDEQALLAAYARGVNRAFERGRLTEGDAFVLLDVHADRWEPWDALAVERLVTYLATPPVAPADSVAAMAYRAHPALRRFVAADSTFRRALGLGGMEHSLAFTVSDSTGSALAQRIVYGTSALPLVREVGLRQGGREMIVATIPGTLMAPGGAGERAWSIFLTSTASLAQSPAELPEPAYARIVHRNGDETLVTTYRRPGALVLFDPAAPAPQPTVLRDTAGVVIDTIPAAAPTTWEVRWRGLAPGTDLAAWRALLAGEEPAFTVLPGDGVLLDADGQARVLGSPAVTRPLPGGVFAGAHPLTRHVADRLAADTVEVGRDGLLADAFSAWAAGFAPPLIRALGGPGESEDDLRDAAAYLRGWDFRFAPSSVGAAIFVRWMEAHRAATGRLPDPAAVAAPPPPPDSLGRVAEVPAAALAKQTLRLAVAQMREEFGDDRALWRWQNTQRTEITYPFLEDARGRFAPFHLPDGGHPTTLAWGPSVNFPEATAATAWAALARPSANPSLDVRHRDIFGAVRAEIRPDDPVRTRTLAPGGEPVRTIRLSPAG